MKWKKQFAGNSSLVLSLQMYKNTLGVKKRFSCGPLSVWSWATSKSKFGWLPITPRDDVDEGRNRRIRLKLRLTGTQPTYNDCRGGSRDWERLAPLGVYSLVFFAGWFAIQRGLVQALGTSMEDLCVSHKSFIFTSICVGRLWCKFCH